MPCFCSSECLPLGLLYEKMSQRALIVDSSNLLVQIYFLLLLRHKVKVMSSSCRDTSGEKEMKQYSISFREKEETDQNKIHTQQRDAQ